ncbi:MAG: galactokinase [Pirellulales bacterium]
MSAGLLDQLVTSASDRFQQRYGGPPRWIVAAPGRVNIIGEHIDYNEGFVLPMAIDRYCVIAAGDCPLFLPRADAPPHSAHQEKGTVPFATVFSVATDDEATISLAAPQRNATPGHWSNYVAGVIAGFAHRHLRPPAFQAVVESGVPVGGGLSSSASLEVATATLLEAMTGTSLHPVEKALLCQKAEHEWAGVPCGIMDQFASVMCRADHLMLLDCRSQHVEHIPFSDPNLTVLIANTNVKHELSGGEYAERRGQCESAARKLRVVSLRDATLEQLESQQQKLEQTEFRRARHAISEIERTRDAADAVKAGDWSEVGRLMNESHDSLRDDYEVSCRELDLLVDLAQSLGRKGGVFGSRMTGGGFGGCTVSLVETAKVDAVAQHLASSYRTQTGIEPSVLTSRPARGAYFVETR